MYRVKSPEWVRHLDFEVLDVLCLALAAIAVQHFFCDPREALSGRYTMHMCGLLGLLYCVVLFFSHPYKSIIQRGYWKEFTAVVKLYSAIEMLMVFSMFLSNKSGVVQRKMMLTHWILCMVTAYLLRLCLKWRVRATLDHLDKKQILLVTDEEHAIRTYHEVMSKRYTRYQVSVMALECEEGSEPDTERLIKECPEMGAVKFLHEKEKFWEFLRTQVVDEIFIDSRRDVNYWREPMEIMLQMGIVVHYCLEDMSMDFPNRTLEHFGQLQVLTTTIGKSKSWQLTIKRIADIFGALVGLVLTGLVSIFLIPAMQRADRGPIIFAQTRIGTNGRPFKFYKFRSMYMDAEDRKAELMSQNEMQGLMFKIENDPRIIGSEKGPGKGFGNFIRKTSLDELPQFWNVLKGDMSLVGTRPPTEGEYKQYELRHKVRLSMKPGITGMWQISGRSDITDFEEVVKLDTYYIENWTLGMDIKILLKTILVVFHMDGSR